MHLHVNGTNKFEAQRCCDGATETPRLVRQKQRYHLVPATGIGKEDVAEGDVAYNCLKRLAHIREGVDLDVTVGRLDHLRERDIKDTANQLLHPMQGWTKSQTAVI